MRRFMSTMAALAATTSLIGSPAFGSPTGDSSAATEQKMICKSQKSSTSRVPKRTCMAKAEWEAAAERAKKQAAEEFNAPRINQGRD